MVQAEAQVASAEQALLNAEVQWRNQELALKRLLIGGADDPLLGQTINPTDLPTFQEQTIDLEAAIDVAMQERTDIRQQREQRRISELDLEVTRDNSRPQLNLTGGYSLQGIGGNLFERSTLGGDPVLVQQGGYLDGLSSIAGFDTPTWNVTINFTYPVGMKAANANLERAQLQLRQTRTCDPGPGAGDRVGGDRRRFGGDRYPTPASSRAAQPRVGRAQRRGRGDEVQRGRIHQLRGGDGPGRPDVGTPLGAARHHQPNQRRSRVRAGAAGRSLGTSRSDSFPPETGPRARRR